MLYLILEIQSYINYGTCFCIYRERNRYKGMLPISYDMHYRDTEERNQISLKIEVKLILEKEVRTNR